jgi:hypothetical protein
VVAVESANTSDFLTNAEGADVPAQVLGQSNDSGDLLVQAQGKRVLSADVSRLQKHWEDAIPARMSSS